MASPAAPALGIVVPVRNAAPFVAAALRSVLAQVPAGTDVLVVDGGSEDGSAAIAAALAGVRVVAQGGRGLAAARNQGLRSVRGDIIGFCDADDRWAAGALALRLAALHGPPPCDAAIGHIATEAIPGAAHTRQQEARLGRPVPGFTPGAMLARREVFEQVGPFDESLAIGADSDWFVRLVQSPLRLAVLADIVLHKGARAASLSADVDAYRRELLRIARGFLVRRRAP